MAGENQSQTNDKDVEKLEQDARKAADTAEKKKVEAKEAEKTPEQRSADKAEQKAIDANAEAVAAKAEQVEAGKTEVTTARDAKAETASTDPDRSIGDHHVQRFANTPANPQPAPGLDKDIPDDQKVRLELSDSDNPDPDHPKVCYVHERMVGDYLRAGWRRPAA